MEKIEDILTDLLVNGVEGKLEISCKLEITHALKLAELLERYYATEGKNLISVTSRYYADGSGCMVAEDFWKEGEHPQGCVDKELLVWGNTIKGENDEYS